MAAVRMPTALPRAVSALRRAWWQDRHYPFGTVLVINGEVYTVEDRGGSGIENDIARVDIYVEDHKQALRLGRYWAEATFYRIGR